MDKQTLLRKLAPFLPYWIDVSWKYTDGSFWRPQQAELGLGNAYLLYPNEGIMDVKPHLRPFSHLISTILHEGKEVIPAVEVAKLAIGNKDAVFKVSCFGDRVCLRRGVNGISDVEIDKNYNVYKYICSRCEETHNQVAIIDLLRSMHFAVGFAEGEYIEKEVLNG